MAETYVIAPAHIATGTTYGNAEDAARAAAALVERDRVPRVVLRVSAEVRPSPRPQVDVAFAEVANG